MALLHARGVTLALVTPRRGPLWLQASVGVLLGNRWLLQGANEKRFREGTVYRYAAKVCGPERARRPPWVLRAL